jgi:hypothetical protein
VCGIVSLEVKYDLASRLKCTATLIIDDIQHSKKSCHDECEFRTVPLTISCCKLHFYHPKLLHIKLQFYKRNKRTPLPPLPKYNFNLAPRIWEPRDQLRPGSFLPRRKSLGTRLINDNFQYLIKTICHVHSCK